MALQPFRTAVAVIAFILSAFLFTRPVAADTVEFHVSRDNLVTSASINGTAVPVPFDWSIQRMTHSYFDTDTNPGRVSFVMYLTTFPYVNGPIMAVGDVATPEWGRWEGDLGSIPLDWPSGEWILGGRDLADFAGAPVTGRTDGGSYVVTIGRAPVWRADLFSFLMLWFDGDPLADWNQDGTVSVQDIFDFLEDYLR